MANEFSVQRPLAGDGSGSGSQRRRVLVTGAAGNIGFYFAEHSHQRYDLRLMVRETDDVPKLSPFGDVQLGDLADLESMKRLCDGVDTVVHMAGNPSPNATWAELFEPNIVGVYNTFIAAKSARCRRVIYASSIHAVSGYPADVQVKPNEPVNPGDLYGVTKCFGEGMARYMAEQEGLSSIVLRIGAFQPVEATRDHDAISMADAWVSERDMNQLIQRCIDVEHLRFAIFNGLSNNRFKRLDISNARDLVGYAPQDDFTREHPALRELHLDEKVASHSVSDHRQQSGIRDEVK